MKAPAFQLYAADFYMDTNTWSIEEIGIYTRLLFSQWVNGPLPNDETRLARASGCSVKRFRGGWSQVKLKFSVTEDDKLYNERLEMVRQEQIEFQEIQRVKGIKSAKKRWAGHVTTVKPRLQPGHKPDCNPSSSSSSSNKKKDIIPKKLYSEVIFLTEAEYGKLTAKYGEPLTLKAIEILNNAIQSKGYKYKSHYHTLIGWPILEAQGGNGNGKGIRTNRSDPRDASLQSREDAEIAAITAQWEASKKTPCSNARGTAGNNDAPNFQGE